ncbi:MAG: AarF/ABC1/UbiB kinase family protein [Cytophagales bacterium]|nr:MAG: AarF/ABC1/UbiB kinase family protein [Cytophagales bacterium]TAF62334.1 MAG: AarF/ABC1/UbiB kinase family protein [Cytophagales bacterium]
MENPKDKEELSSIPTSKVQRAAQFMKTGVKVGSNYVKHYAKKVVNPSLSKDELNAANAEDVYESLSQLKGSALKMAQMLSMYEDVLPQAYIDKFKMSQYSAPALSLPLVVNTFKKQFNKSPFEMYDSFSKEAKHAASIGQVHEAYLKGKRLAVKVQYPGVADSITSDLRMVKPFAQQMVSLNEKEMDLYMNEVEEMMTAETNYLLERERSERISKACAHIPNLYFPSYYPELSSERVLTMDWLEGQHAEAFLAEHEPSQEVRNKIGQAIWDFYDFQMHELLEVHADPHPGNFLMKPDGTVGVIDFGCVKVIPPDYYKAHFSVINNRVFTDKVYLQKVFRDMEFLKPDDTAEEIEFFTNFFTEMLDVSTRPFRSQTFDFGDQVYFKELYEFGERLAKLPELRSSKQARGSRHALYLNRSYFGLYYLLNLLNANVITGNSIWFQKQEK